ncbi:unnamed protein product, partial [Medioppia subpectinata]
MPIDLYFATLSPPSRAVLMTLKQLKLDVNVIDVNFQKGEHLTEEYLKRNPQHTVPTLVDDGFSLSESRAIMQYLVSKYAPNSALYPTHDLKKRAHVDRLLYYDMSIGYAIRDAVMIKVMRGVEPHENSVKNFKNNFKVLDTFIGDNKYVAGNELTIADISYLSTLTALALNDYKELDDFPNVKNWFFRVQKELPYFNEYLVSKYAPNSALYPTHDLKKRANVDRLLYYDMSIWYAIRDVVMIKLFRGDDPHPNAVKNFHNNFTVLNNFIGDNKYVAGNELTIADISYLATLTPLSINDYKQLDDFPNVKNWFFRVQKELPYFEEVNGKVPQLFKQFTAAKNANSYQRKAYNKISDNISKNKMTIDLYFLSLSPPCRAVLMTAKHLNIDVNIKNVDFSKSEHMSPEYLKLNPTHKVPTIVDDELVLFESRAIMQYLCNKYAPKDSLYPSDPKQRALVDRWLNTDLSYFLATADVLVC